MKSYKLYLILTTTLCTISLFCIVNQRSTIKNLTKDINILTDENKKMSDASKELKISIDIMDKNIVSLKHELENDASFKSFVHFNPDNITEPSGITYKQLSYALNNTKLSAYIDSFLSVEKHYNINALAMVGIVANESAWLTSDRTLRQNNVTGYAVYSDSSEGASFSSIDESILKTAELLAKDYIDPQGKHYNGLSVSDINIMYSSDSEWYDTVSSIGNQLKDRVNKMVELLYS